MFPVERLTRIREILLDKKQIDISYLSNALHVTEVTIRRDLEKLESEGFLARTHGGAVLIENAARQESISPFELEPQTDALIRMIGTIAGFFIKDNEIVFLGPGISNRYFHLALKDKKNVTVVTNDIFTAMNLGLNAPETKIICPGGELNCGDMQLYGRISEIALRNLNFSIAFIDVDGISLERGYSVSTLEKSFLIQDIMKVSEKTIAIANSLRFNQNSFVPLGPLDMFKAVISNEQTPEDYKEYFFRNNIQFFCTFDAYRG